MAKKRKDDSHRKIAGKWNKIGRLKKSDLPGLAQGALLSMAIALLFYRSVWGFAVSIFVMPFWLIQYRNEQKEKRISRLKTEFKEYMLLISAALQTGYSLERAMLVSEEELKKLFGKESIIQRSVHSMNQKVALNIQVEKAFEEFARETGLEDAECLAEILSFSKRSGGDYSKQIRNTALKLEEKLRVEQEIETLTTEKKLELKVMSIMPLGILAYISLTSISFIQPLYGNWLGVILMSICLVFYGMFIMLGKKIVDIDI